MKKILTVVIVFSLTACANKKPWTKDAVVNECLRNFYKKNETEKIFTGMQIPNLCDCMADKLVAKYKSDDETAKDEEGVKQISQECASQVISK